MYIRFCAHAPNQYVFVQCDVPVPTVAYSRHVQLAYLPPRAEGGALTHPLQHATLECYPFHLFMYRFCAELETPAQCQSRFLEVLSAVDPSLGLLTFKCDRGGLEGEDKQAGELVVDPVDGLAFVTAEGGRRLPICKFSEVLAIRAKDGEVDLKYGKVSNNPSPALVTLLGKSYGGSEDTAI